MSFEEALRAALPVETELFSLVLADWVTAEEGGGREPSVKVRPDGATVATFQLWAWERVGAERKIRDIKEQEVVVLAAKHRADPRAAAYAAGWADAVHEVFAQQEALLKRDRTAYERFGQAIDCLLPHDFCAPEVLDLKRLTDAASFTDALLSSKKRLGRYLP